MGERWWKVIDYIKSSPVINFEAQTFNMSILSNCSLRNFTFRSLLNCLIIHRWNMFSRPPPTARLVRLWRAPLTRTAAGRRIVDPLFMITCKYSVFLSALFTFFHSLIPVYYLRCSESTQSFCLLFSHLSSLQGNTDFRPSWPQPACFLITLMSETCKDIISLKCLLLVEKKKTKKNTILSWRDY